MTQESPFGAASARSELLTRREAAAYLGVSEQTLAIWKCTGRYNLPYIKIGRLVKYKLSDLNAFIARNHMTA
ncbi:MAG: helix-turn-helix domain-containing protein [Candidatus Obscuribacterales bacterium]|nr:helix-turn-helix domain-containing protein [Candidatus Obscuribacterales bacterium]